MNKIESPRVYLSEEDFSYKNQTQGDPVGRVFSYNSRLFRGIYPHAIHEVEGLFSSGLIGKLESEALILGFNPTQFYSDSYPLILESKYIQEVSYVSGLLV